MRHQVVHRRPGTCEKATAASPPSHEPLELARCRGCRRRSRSACRSATSAIVEDRARAGGPAGSARRAPLIGDPPPALGAAATSVCHAPAEIHRALALARGGAVRPSRPGSRCRERGEERLRRQPGQILDRPVVGQDLHLVVGEGHREEPAASTRRVPQPRGVARPGRARRAMVAVGDVERGHVRERRGDARRRRRRSACQTVCATPSGATKS